MGDGVLILALVALFFSPVIYIVISSILKNRKGHIQIVIPKQMWNGGETLTGKVIVTAYRDISCRRLSINLSKIMTTRTNKKTKKRTLYSEQKELASLVQLSRNSRREYDFQFLLPEYVPSDNQPIVLGLGNLANHSPIPVGFPNQNFRFSHRKWRLFAYLDAEGVDLTGSTRFFCNHKEDPNAVRIDVATAFKGPFKFILLVALMFFLSPVLIGIFIWIVTKFSNAQ